MYGKRFHNYGLFFIKFLLFRSSRPEVFYKKDVFRNFAKFKGKHLCKSLFFNKVAGLRPATLLKKRLWHRYFPVNFAKFLRTPFLTEYLQWLLLTISRELNNCKKCKKCKEYHYFLFQVQIGKKLFFFQN